MKKKVLKSVFIIVGFVLLIPKIYYLNDGGTVEYRAFLYHVVRYHSINLLLDDGYDDGIQINILGLEIYRKLDSDSQSNFSSKKEIFEQIVQVDGNLYYNTEKESPLGVRCGTMDGYITSHVSPEKVPTIDNQANFEGDYGYQFGYGNTIEVNLDGKWIIFEKNK